MTGIKILLLIPLLGLMVLFITRLRNRTFYRLTLILISGIGTLFVLFPSLTDRLANLLGVGRGADLVTYLFIIFFFVGGIILYSRIRKLETQQTELIRLISLLNAKKLNGKEHE